MPAVAVRAVVAYEADVVLPLGAESTASVLQGAPPALPSVRAQSRTKRKGGRSSSWIVPVADGRPMVALLAPESVTVNVSASSSAASATTGTTTALWVVPGGKVTLPDVVT